MTLKYVDVVWISGINTIGFVLCHDDITNEKKAYIGVASNFSEAFDIESIMKFGTKVPKTVAEAVFNRELENYAW